jgi:uncharacterized protein (PEP-CTERM system associated)
MAKRKAAYVDWHTDRVRAQLRERVEAGGLKKIFAHKALRVSGAVAAIAAALPTYALAQQVYGPQENNPRPNGYGQVVLQDQEDPYTAADNIGANPREERRTVKRTGRPFNYQLTVSPQLTYSDNVTLAPSGEEQADGLASVAFEGGALIDRVGFSGIINGRVELGTYFDQPQVNGEDLYDQFVVDQNITAAGTARIVDDLFYVDAALNSKQQALSDQSQFSGQSIAANDQQANAFSYSISPYLFSRLINDGTVEARYRYTNVIVDDEDAIDGIDDFLNDSETQEIVAEYDSGRLLDRVGFSVRGYANKTEETGSERLPEVDFEQLALSWSARYAMNRKVSVIGTVGYDEIDTNNNPNFDDDELSGVFWKAGLRAKPGRRTLVQVEVGDRYGGALVEGSASYQYSSRLEFRANLERNFRTGAQAVNQNSTVLQSETLAFAEELRLAQDVTSRDLTARTLQLNSDLQEFSARQSGLATTNSARLTAIGRTRRDNFVVSATYDDSDFGFQETENISLGGTWDRRLSRKLGVYARGNLQLTENSISSTSVMDCITALSTDPLTAGLPADVILGLCGDPSQLDNDVQTLSLLGGLRYRLFENTAAFAQVSRTQRFADTDAQEYEENAITVGLSFDF